MDWIVSQATDTTKIPTGDNLFYIIQTTEIIDNKGNLYKKVDVSTLMKNKQIEEQELNIAKSSFKKFSERGIVQKRRTHRNKRAKQKKNGEEYSIEELLDEQDTKN